MNLSSGCSTAVTVTPCYIEVVGSVTTGCWAFSTSIRSNVSSYRSHKEVLHYCFSSLKNECLAMQLGAKKVLWHSSGSKKWISFFSGMKSKARNSQQRAKRLISRGNVFLLGFDSDKMFLIETLPELVSAGIANLCFCRWLTVLI